MDTPTGTAFTLSDCVGVLRRRAPLLCTIFALIVLVGAAIAYRVPPLYASTGVLFAERAATTEHVVPSAAPDLPEDRVRIVTQRVLTDENLERIIEDNHLYSSLGDARRAAIRRFREHVELSAEDPQILENILGSSGAADAVAFSLTFSNPSPQIARDVAVDLIDLYLNENQRARREQAEEATLFLTREAQRLDAEISEREERLAAFKRQNVGRLPESADMNLQLLDRLERDLESAEQEIRSLRERQALYASELALLSPRASVVDEEGQTILSPDERLTLLERRYAQLSAIYSQEHPDVLKVRREIDTLRVTSGARTMDRAALQTELAVRQDELAAARARYSLDHPDVLRLERVVEGLRAAMFDSPVRAYAGEADNPVYIQRQVQLQATEAELQAAVARREQLSSRLSELESRVTGVPDVEREFNSLNRGYEQLLAQYADVERRLREAEIAQNLESENGSGRFAVLQSPELPSSPASPNRMAVLMLTLIVALMAGAGGAAIAEQSDPTIRHPRDVAERLGTPPIVAIPYVSNRADERSRAHRQLLAAAAGCVWVATITFLVMTPAG